MMLDMETPYLDMLRAQHFKFKKAPTVLHQQTCPECGRKLVNTYYSEKLEKYICKKCSDALL